MSRTGRVLFARGVAIPTEEWLCEGRWAQPLA
eukprot:CAMPEP_0170077696 /NCGR_PEP_ID=MMETSP0019_2-20121128/14458_1 /TAXON_ID=98059 /ORGANISM="Dinobryon sp., Strain UTEXLB2267" /LENGTH=31 /DNA_ID= /DNA_START= /DNA_END= /DNA_ORIENTATION=